MNQPTIINGWKCNSCGSWVPSGTSHVCSWPSQANGWVATFSVDNSALILAELREIKQLLKEKETRDTAQANSR